MSYNEYNDMVIPALDKGKYKVFTFDVVGSKKINDYDRYVLQEKLILLSKLLYYKIKLLEKNYERKILLSSNDKRFSTLDSVNSEVDRLKQGNCIGMRIDPNIIGDVLYITIYRDSIKDEEVINIFNYYKELLDIKYDFHIVSLYYETNEWGEGLTQYYRGYAIQLASEIHKESNKDLFDKLKDRKDLYIK